MNLVGTEFGSVKFEKPYSKVVWEGEVVSLLDGEQNGVIRVRIPELDKMLTDEQLPICVPLFSFSFFRVLPKVGERVTLLFRNIYNTRDSNMKDFRYWISVVHSNIYNLEFQPFNYESTAHYPDGTIRQPKKTSVLPEANGIYASKEDISINSRNNSSIFLKSNQLLFKAGAHEKDNSLKFNKTNPAYITLKYPIESEQKGVTTSAKVPVFITPTIELIASFLADTKATIQIKDKQKNKIISTQVYNKPNKAELSALLKSEILGLQKNYPYWELSYTDASLNGLPKLYSTNNTDKNQEVFELTPKNLNFSTSLVAADKIFLVSHLNNEFDVKKQPDLVGDSDLLNLSEKAHPIPYGDRLIEFLDVLRQVVANHVHPYPGMKAVPEDQMLKLLNFNLQALLNKNVLTG